MTDALLLLLIGAGIGFVFERVWSDLVELLDIWIRDRDR